MLGQKAAASKDNYWSQLLQPNEQLRSSEERSEH